MSLLIATSIEQTPDKLMLLDVPAVAGAFSIDFLLNLMQIPVYCELRVLCRPNVFFVLVCTLHFNFAQFLVRSKNEH